MALIRTRKDVGGIYMKRRSQAVDMWKFIAAAVIMTFHIYEIDVTRPYPTEMNGWVWADFFFIITGYYTYRHLCGSDEGIWHYVFRKFKVIFPYTAIAIAVQYMIDALKAYHDGIRAMAEVFLDMPLELVYLHPEPRIYPLWFLTAMFIALPVYGMIIRVKDKRIFPVLMVFPLIFYMYYYPVQGNNTVYVVIRALAGLMAGGGIALTAAWAGREYEILLQKKRLLFILEALFLILPLILVIINANILPSAIILFFAAGLAILLPGYGSPEERGNGIMNYLGALSLPVFIWHTVIGRGMMSAFHLFCDRWGLFNMPSVMARIAVYYGLTFIIAAISYRTVEGLRRAVGRKHVS